MSWLLSTSVAPVRPKLLPFTLGTTTVVVVYTPKWAVQMVPGQQPVTMTGLQSATHVPGSTQVYVPLLATQQRSFTTSAMDASETNKKTTTSLSEMAFIGSPILFLRSPARYIEENHAGCQRKYQKAHCDGPSSSGQCDDIGRTRVHIDGNPIGSYDLGLAGRGHLEEPVITGSLNVLQNFFRQTGQVGSAKFDFENGASETVYDLGRTFHIIKTIHSARKSFLRRLVAKADQPVESKRRIRAKQQFKRGGTVVGDR